MKSLNSNLIVGVLCVALCACGDAKPETETAAALADAGTPNAAPSDDAGVAGSMGEQLVDAGSAGAGGNSASAGGAGGAAGDNGGAAQAGGAAGDSASAGSGGSGDVIVDNPNIPCSKGGWSFVEVEPTGAYGTQTFQVPAAQSWVNSGLYLRTGEQAVLTATGAWSVGVTEGLETVHGPCVTGDLVARIGLNLNDENLTCVSGETTVTADKDGILYLAALTSGDVLESYESRFNATGSKMVTVQSTAGTSPTIAAAAVADYDFEQVTSDLVEITGEHVIVTLPLATAKQDRARLFAALTRLDTFYDLHTELRGDVPHNGQCVRFFPDPTVKVLMYAGNPVRMRSDLTDTTNANRISLAGDEGARVWGFAHELGHDFTFLRGIRGYQDAYMESWANLFTMYAFAKLGLAPLAAASECTANSSGNYVTGDALEGLCFLMQFQFRYGWEFYQKFFADLNGRTRAEVPSGEEGTAWVHDRFEEIAGEDITPLFNAWGVSLP